MAPTGDTDQRLCGLGLWLDAPRPRGSDDDVLEQAAAAAGAAERTGLTSVWVVETRAEPPDAVPYEAFSLLGALATRTGAVHLGLVADGGQRRPPSILAKLVSTVDVLSHGRAILSLDGDRSQPADVHRLGEALAVARAVLEDEHPTVDGRIYSVVDAVNRPAPVQPGGVPLVVFVNGAGPGDALLDRCARSADAVVVPGGPESVRDAVTFLEGWTGPRDRRRHPVAVLGRVVVDDQASAAEAVAAVREAGADGCLVGVPAPWSAEQVEALQLHW